MYSYIYFRQPSCTSTFISDYLFITLFNITKNSVVNALNGPLQPSLHIVESKHLAECFSLYFVMCILWVVSGTCISRHPCHFISSSNSVLPWSCSSNSVLPWSVSSNSELHCRCSSNSVLPWRFSVILFTRTFTVVRYTLVIRLRRHSHIILRTILTPFIQQDNDLVQASAARPLLHIAPLVIYNLSPISYPVFTVTLTTPYHTPRFSIFKLYSSSVLYQVFLSSIPVPLYLELIYSTLSPLLFSSPLTNFILFHQ